MMFKIMIKSITPIAILFTSLLFTVIAQAGIAVQQYTVTTMATGNGSVSPNTPQMVNSGDHFTFTATPNSNYMVKQWKVDGHVMQTGGVNFTLNNIEANHAVEVIFTPQNLLYVAGANSYLYYSLDNGDSWHVTPTRPNVNNAIGGVVATRTAVYVVTTSKYVFYSLNNGTTWISTTAAPDDSGVESIFVTPSNTIYIGTKKGHVFYSTNSGHTWIATPTPPSVGNSVNSIYVVGHAMYVGSANGRVYYSTDGVTWTTINGALDGSAIHSVWVTNSTLYVNTANENVYTSTALTGGGSWTLFALRGYSLFVSTDGSVIDAATKNGYVFALSTGNELGFVSYTPINSLFFLG